MEPRQRPAAVMAAAELCGMGLFRESVIGLDVGDRYLAAAELRSDRRDRLRLRHAGWVERPPKAGPPELASALRGLWRRAGLGSRTVCCCIHSRSLALRHFRHANLSGDELASALQLEAEEALQLGPEQIVSGWHVNRTAAETRTDGEVEGFLVALPRADVDWLLRVLKLAGLYPVVMDVACLAVANLFRALNEAECRGQTVCLVHLSRHRAEMAILQQGSCLYPRTFFSRSAALEDTTDYLVQNICDELRYYQYKLRRDPVQRMVLTGHVPTQEHEGGFREEKVLGEIQRAANLPIQFWDPLSRVRPASLRLAHRLKQDGEARSRLVIGMGLALRGI